MKVLVCGGRDFSDGARIERVLGQIFEYTEPDEEWLVIHGDCRGADVLAGEAAERMGAHQVRCPANWKAFGPKAGPMRNDAMLALKPDLVVAFPGGRGTADMVRRAKAAGVAVRQIVIGVDTGSPDGDCTVVGAHDSRTGALHIIDATSS